MQKIFKVKVAAVRTAIFHGKFRRRGRAEGHRRDWKKAYVKLAAGREDDRVRGEFVASVGVSVRREQWPQRDPRGVPGEESNDGTEKF